MSIITLGFPGRIVTLGFGSGEAEVPSAVRARRYYVVAGSAPRLADVSGAARVAGDVSGTNKRSGDING